MYLALALLRVTRALEKLHTGYTCPRSQGDLSGSMSWSLRLHGPTCHTGHPQGLLVLWSLGAVLAALFAPRGPDATEMDLCGLEEGHHEGLLVLGSMPSNQACQLGVDALSCRGGIQCWGQGRAGGHNSIPTSYPVHTLAVHSSNRD